MRDQASTLAAATTHGGVAEASWAAESTKPLPRRSPPSNDGTAVATTQPTKRIHHYIARVLLCVPGSSHAVVIINGASPIRELSANNSLPITEVALRPMGP